MELPEYCLEYLLESWNQFGKILGVRLTSMQIKWDPYQDDATTRGSREESKGEESISLLSPSSKSRGQDSS